MATETLLPTATDYFNGHLFIDEGVDTHDGGSTVVPLYWPGGPYSPTSLAITAFQSPTITGPITQITLRFAALVYGLGGDTMTASVGGLTGGPSGVVALTNTFAIYELSASGSWSTSEIAAATAAFTSHAASPNYIWITAAELVISNLAEPTYDQFPPFTDDWMPPRRRWNVYPY